MMSDVTLPFCVKTFRSVGLITPIVIASFGLLGTLMSLLVIPRMKYFIGKIECFLLVCLSSTDFIILAIQVIKILAFENDFDSFRATSVIAQRALRRILLMFYFIETWIIVLIAVNRFIALCFPFYQGRLNTPLFIKISVAVVVVVSIALNAVDFSTFKIPFSNQMSNWGKNVSLHHGTDLTPHNYTSTTIIPGGKKNWDVHTGSGFNTSYKSIWQYKWYVNYVLVVDRLLIAFIPMLIIIILDVSMISVLIKMRRTRSAMTMQKGVSGTNTAIAILLSVAISYVIINLPYHAFVIHVWYVDRTGDPCNFVKMALNLAMIVNCSVNFILYFVLSSTFRKTLKQIFTNAATCYCRRTLNTSRDDTDNPNKVPLIFLSKQNGTKPKEDKKAKNQEGQEENKTPIYRPVPKPRSKKQSVSSGGPTSELFLSTNEV